jgi:transposase-like protein
MAREEEAASWGTFVRTLYATGLTEQTTQPIVSDSSQGLDKALYSHLYGVPPQRCLFHKSKNSAEHLQYTALLAEAGAAASAPSRPAKQAYKQAILAEASQTYATAVAVEIRARAQACRDKWQAREPQAVAAWMPDFEQTLSALAVEFPRGQVSGIRTTHLLERFHKALRRKQRDSGMLQSEADGDVLWYLVAMRETAKQRATWRWKGEGIREKSHTLPSWTAPLTSSKAFCTPPLGRHDVLVELDGGHPDTEGYRSRRCCSSSVDFQFRG